MGLRFQRRVRLFPGVSLNLSRSGVGVSMGTRGVHVGITSRGRRYTSVGLPGTGVSWREYQGKPVRRQCELCGQPGHTHIPAALVGALLVLAGVALLAALSAR